MKLKFNTKPQVIYKYFYTCSIKKFTNFESSPVTIYSMYFLFLIHQVSKEGHHSIFYDHIKKVYNLAGGVTQADLTDFILGLNYILH